MQFPTGGDSPRPTSFEVAESVKFRYRQYSLDKEDRAYLICLWFFKCPLFPCGKEGIFYFVWRRQVRNQGNLIGSFEEES